MVGTGVAAKHHVLIKGSDVLDSAHRVNYILFDKTGTLTLGKPKVTDFMVVPTFSGMVKVFCVGNLQGLSEDEMWAFINSAEANSEHPLGRCIAKHAKKASGGKTYQSTDFQVNFTPSCHD